MPDLIFTGQKDVTMIDVSHIATKLKSMFTDIGMVRTFRGTGPNEGKFKLVVQLPEQADLHITVDAELMLTRKDYFNGMMDDIHRFREQALAKRQLMTRIGYH